MFLQSIFVCSAFGNKNITNGKIFTLVTDKSKFFKISLIQYWVYIFLAVAISFKFN